MSGGRLAADSPSSHPSVRAHLSPSRKFELPERQRQTRTGTAPQTKISRPEWCGCGMPSPSTPKTSATSAPAGHHRATKPQSSAPAHHACFSFRRARLGLPVHAHHAACRLPNPSRAIPILKSQSRKPGISFGFGNNGAALHSEIPITQ
jgi:hypothetical protein